MCKKRFMQISGYIVSLILMATCSCPVFSATGIGRSGMESFDTVIPALMSRWDIPGAAVAVMKEGRLIFARGYGYADKSKNELVMPDSLFRIASISKPITATCVMRLVEEGKISLDTKVFPFLDLGIPSDARLNQITVRNFLEHTGGWDRDISGDPIDNMVSIARTMGVSSPPDPTTFVRYMLTQSLDFNPGLRYAYSNAGYIVLGRVIEKISGQSYESYARSVLSELGITELRIGYGLPAERFLKEVQYYTDQSLSPVTSIYDRVPGTVTWSDGGFSIESIDSAGGWVGSAVDLVIFASSFVPSASHPLLAPATISEMIAKPSYAAAESTAWYSKGWGYNAGNIFHDGTQPGQGSLLVRTSDGYVWAILINTRPAPLTDDYFADIDRSLWSAIDGVTDWPASPIPFPISSTQSDCIFRYAEKNYPHYFTSTSVFSNYTSGYYYRYYPDTKDYLATSSTDQHIWVYGPSFVNKLIDVAPASSFFSVAGCQ